MTGLADALAREDTREEAAKIIRSLVDGILLTPEDGKLAITLQGDLAAMLSYAASNKKPGASGKEAGFDAASGSQFTLVAGVGFEPTTFRL